MTDDAGEFCELVLAPRSPWRSEVWDVVALARGPDGTFEAVRVPLSRGDMAITPDDVDDAVSIAVKQLLAGGWVPIDASAPPALHSTFHRRPHRAQ